MGAATEIVILNGSGGVGKDEVVRIAERLLADQRDVLAFSTVDTVKKACRRYFGVDPDTDKTDAKRQLWSDIKDAWTRYNDGPFQEVCHLVSAMDAVVRHGAAPTLVFFHVREPAEIQKLKDHFGARCHRLLVTNSRCPVPPNHADRNVHQTDYDYWIPNEGSLDDLTATVQALLRTLLGPKTAFNRKDGIDAQEECPPQHPGL